MRRGVRRPAGQGGLVQVRAFRLEAVGENGRGREGHAAFGPKTDVFAPQAATEFVSETNSALPSSSVFSYIFYSLLNGLEPVPLPLRSPDSPSH
jgi:hypothetical protein